MDYLLLHLKGINCSGRAVKMKPLSPDELDSLKLQAAKAIGADGTMADLMRQEWKLGVLHTIKQVSDATMEPNGANVKWKKVNPEKLDEEYSKLFTAKDHAVLVAAYRHHHEVTMEEINAIVGKALMVSED